MFIPVYNGNPQPGGYTISGLNLHTPVSETPISEHVSASWQAGHPSEPLRCGFEFGESIVQLNIPIELPDLPRSPWAKKQPGFIPESPGLHKILGGLR